MDILWKASSENYVSWESPDNTPFTKAIRNVLMRGVPVGDQPVPFCLELSRL